MPAYYNEHDKGKAAWLRELIKAGAIAPGEVDERDVRDIAPRELVGYTQCHFFAGIGIWSYALRQAGWPDERPCWTGSCPCQSFSSAGRRLGFADERHLWPAWFWLISICAPERIFGEQVASKDAEPWIDLVSADLEGAGYSIGALDLCAAGFGAPHIRQRMFWCAYARYGIQPLGRELGGPPRQVQGEALQRQRVRNDSGDGREPLQRSSDADDERQQTGRGTEPRRPGRAHEGKPAIPDGLTNGFWAGAEWLPCRDGKFRPTEPGLFPLAHGAPARVLRLRGYGDGIVLPVAQAFIEASM